MTFPVENGHENGILGRDRLYTSYGVRKAYEDGKIYVYLINLKWYFPYWLITGKCHVDSVY